MSTAWCTEGDTVISLRETDVPRTIAPDQNRAVASATLDVNALHLLGDPDYCTYSTSFGDIGGLRVRMTVFLDDRARGTNTRCIPNNAVTIGDTTETISVEFDTNIAPGQYDLRVLFDKPDSGTFVAECNGLLEKEESPPDPPDDDPDPTDPHTVSLSAPSSVEVGTSVDVSAQFCCSGECPQRDAEIALVHPTKDDRSLAAGTAPGTGCRILSGSFVADVAGSYTVHAFTDGSLDTKTIVAEEVHPECPPGYTYDPDREMCVRDEPTEIPSVEKPEYDGEWVTVSADLWDDESAWETGDIVRHEYQLDVPGWLPGRDIAADVTAEVLALTQQINSELPGQEEIDILWVNAEPRTSDEQTWDITLDYEITHASPIAPLVIHAAIIAVSIFLAAAGIALLLQQVRKLIKTEGGKAAFGSLVLLAGAGLYLYAQDDEENQNQNDPSG